MIIYLFTYLLNHPLGTTSFPHFKFMNSINHLQLCKIFIEIKIKMLKCFCKFKNVKWVFAK